MIKLGDIFYYPKDDVILEAIHWAQDDFDQDIIFFNAGGEVDFAVLFAVVEIDFIELGNLYD